MKTYYTVHFISALKNVLEFEKDVITEPIEESYLADDIAYTSLHFESYRWKHIYIVEHPSGKKIVYK